MIPTVTTFCEKQGISVLEEGRKSGNVTYRFIIDPYEYKMVDSFCQTMHITCDILERQVIRKEEPASETVEVPAKEEPAAQGVAASDSMTQGVAAEDSTPSYLSFKFKCSTCEKGFDEAKEHREHFRSDWHRYNMKRKNRNLPIMTEEEFNSLDEEDRELFLNQDSIAT